MLLFFFLQWRIYSLILERKREKHRCERETWIGYFLYMPWLGIESGNQVWTLTGTRTSNLLVFKTMLQPTEPPRQGKMLSWSCLSPDQRFFSGSPLMYYGCCYSKFSLIRYPLNCLRGHNVEPDFQIVNPMSFFTVSPLCDLVTCLIRMYLFNKYFLSYCYMPESAKY